MTSVYFARIAELVPDLGPKLRRAGIRGTPEEFMKKTIFSSLLVGGLGMFFVGIVLNEFDIPMGFIIGMSLVVIVLLFIYFMRIPDAKIALNEKSVNQELVFVGRFMIIELEAGVPMYNVMKNLAANFKIVGKHFQSITNRIDMGTSMEDAINEAVEQTSSDDFRKILWQMLNVIRTGSDVVISLNAVIDQITREQMIQVQQYGKKLNPLAMFYMIIAVILPSIGIIMIIVMSSFMGLSIDLVLLLTIVGFLGFIQFMFVAIMKSSRPAVEL